ncbi:MAG TPA: glutamate-5-semialdehyde dehydrogenase [Nitrospinaceae bacterium]|jgi:glutamate-5-semialdehyde dehydrogenase|nr:glutamate-5-semialdehyde dehydrogenase [Nitrospinaceae bacterium]HJL73036.1 glutamate-5-semialdehyde dehydrogenase [Nitrospinaceae bacterium]HJO00354.1 glutamate-5-semialdehyde dehydrogenase [Nitrospinaceae bacterium]|tara:strand:- start:1041 stop:2345 length:1305 start_codon:yes stop_codon:yes gene_type:complete
MTTKTVSEIAAIAKAAALQLAHLSAEVKNRTLEEIASAIEKGCASILEANAKDLEFAEKENIPGPLTARLRLNENKVMGMVKGIRSVVRLEDPVGQRQMAMEMDQGLTLYRLTCPIGVIGAIFESRPDAVPQISSLCLKSGNAVILKGGREAQNSNKIIVSLIREAIGRVEGVPVGAVQMIETRSEVADMLKEEKNINLVIPRGSNEFVKYIQENTRIPVLGHSEGICHGFIDSKADANKAIAVVLDSKLQYPAACNAMETLLVHEGVAQKILPQLNNQFRAKNVELVGCEQTRKIIPEMAPAVEADWDSEYTDLKLSVKIVSDVSEAIEFINLHGSGHTDSILTEDASCAEQFLNEVDSSSVLWNASTRFADGFRYGLGAEIGISTNKTHARGPVGLDGLVIYKYKLIGSGQTVAEYSGENAREFKHKPLPTS